MRKYRISIGLLMLVVAFAGLGFAALFNPTRVWASVVFTLTLGTLCMGLLLAVARTGRSRLSYLAFSIFGWAYLLSTFGYTPGFNSVSPPPNIISKLISRAIKWAGKRLVYSVNISNPGLAPSRMFLPDIPDVLNEPLHQVSQSLATLLVGLIAALVVPFVVKVDRGRESTDNPSAIP